MRVIWTPEAQAHLDGIYHYLQRDAPFYANGVVDKLTRRSTHTSIIRTPGASCRCTMIETSVN